MRGQRPREQRTTGEATAQAIVDAHGRPLYALRRRLHIIGGDSGDARACGRLLGGAPLAARAQQQQRAALPEQQQSKEKKHAEGDLPYKARRELSQ